MKASITCTRQTAVWTSVLSFPIFALTFSMANPLTVILYGQKYASSAVLLALLSFGYYFNAALGFNGLTLKVYGRLRHCHHQHPCSNYYRD
ncbi:MAG: hypothetical protein U0074_00090 [Kouleothrix sp.]